MAKKATTPTPNAIRKAYVEDYLKRHTDAETFASYTENELADFIRRHVDSSFSSIYERTDHNYYDRVRNKIATNAAMRQEDDAEGQQYSVQLRTYSSFLESKAFKGLFKQKINIEGTEKREPKIASSTSSIIQKPKERAMTEGERKHVEFEMAHRNPALRQACIDKYGYQCQCCGMNFTDLYGEELGAQFIEVHHMKMLSTYDENRPDDYVENLVPLCSNCHSMIHHGKDGPLSLRDLRAAYRGEKKEIKVWKED